MLNVLLRWSIPLAALFLFGPLAAALVSELRASDGGREVSLLICDSREAGIRAGLVALMLALVVGVAGARFIEQRSGLLAAGFVLAWAAWSTGRIDRILAREQTTSVLTTLSVEAMLFGLAALGVATVIIRVPTRMPKFIVRGDATRQLGVMSHHEPLLVLDRSTLLALIAATIGAGLATHIIAAETLKGQTVFAAIAAGILAAAFGRLASQTVSPVVFLAGIVIAAAIGPVSAMWAHSGASASGGGAVVEAAIEGSLFRLARPLPLDWLAGGFIGIPIGLWWASSMIEKQEQGSW